MKQQGGFSLVELMVAMVIGLIIILGAGQLFLTVFQTNRQVETLSEKQAAVNFAVETLLRDIRRAEANSIDWDGGELLLRVPNRGDVNSSCSMVDKIYRLSATAVSAREGWALEMGQACEGMTITDFPHVVAAFEADGFSVDDGNANDGIWVVTLELMAVGQNGAADELVFHAVNRTIAITN